MEEVLYTASPFLIYSVANSDNKEIAFENVLNVGFL